MSNPVFKWWRGLVVLLVGCIAATVGQGADDLGLKFDNLGVTSVTEYGDYRGLIRDRCNVVLELDRVYAVLGLKLAGFEGYVGYVLNPPDGDSSANVMIGTPKYVRSDAEVSQSPGFTQFTRRSTTRNGVTVIWRQWRDAEHLQSDASVAVPVRNGSPGQAQPLYFGVVANSEARREALEDHLLRTTVVNRDTGRLSAPLRTVLDELHIDISQCQLLDADANEARWLNPQNDEVKMRIARRSDIQAPIDDEDALRRFWREEARRNGGGIVAADVHRGKDDASRCATMIAKYPIRSIAGTAYQGVALLPRGDDVIEVEIRARETGTTGAREAIGIAVMATKDAKKGEKLDLAAKAARHDPYDAKFNDGAMYLDSDNPRFDVGLTDHPLTKCRAALAGFVAARKG